MANLVDPPRRERVGSGRDCSPSSVQTELTREEIATDECERLREYDEQVVTDECGDESGAEHAGRRVADQSVRERKAVSERPGGVCIEPVRWLVQERVPVPRHLPGLERWIAQVARDVRIEVQYERPQGNHGERKRREHHNENFSPRQLRGCAHGVASVLTMPDSVAVS